MKISLSILTICLTLILNAQEPITFKEVVQVDSTLDKGQLYTNARTWFAEAFRSAQDVLQMDDRDAGKIIGKGNMRYNSNIFIGSEGTKGWIRYTIDIQVKDGRYKYEVSNFIHEGNSLNSAGSLSFDLITTDEECPYKVGWGSGQKWKNKVWNDIKEQIDLETTSLIASLKNAMAITVENEEDDW